MKGFQEKTPNNGKFFVIKHSSIVQEFAKPKEGFEAIVVTNPQTNEQVTKYIKRYDRLEAMVTKIEFRDTGDQYDQQYVSWKISLEANGDKGVLEIPFNSRIGSRFMKLAENLDFSIPVEFSAWKTVDGTAFSVKQNGQNVPQKYSKEHPGDCPAPKQRLGRKWDFADQMEFLHKQMMSVVIPRVQAVVGSSNGHEEHVSDEPPLSDEDIPF